MPFQCPQCLREFQRRAALRNHVKAHENVIDKYIEEIIEERKNTILNERQYDSNEASQYNTSLEDIQDTRFDFGLQSFDDQLDQQIEQQQEEVEYDNTLVEREMRSTNIEDIDVEKEPNIEEMDVEEQGEEIDIEGEQEGEEMEEVDIDQV